MPITPRRLAVLASGGGSNLQAILDYLDALGAAAPAVVVLVATNRSGAPVVDRARARGIATATLTHPTDGESLATLLERHGVNLIALAGYLRMVPPEVTRRWKGSILNVHPALLPKHGGPGMYGRAVHQAVIAGGDQESGATVHFVDDSYDRGAGIARVRLPVLAGESAEQLATRVLAAEHALYPRAIHAVAAGWISLDDHGRAWISDRAALASQLPVSAYAIEILAAAAAEPH